MIRKLKSWKSPEPLRAPSLPAAHAVPLHPSEPPSPGLPAQGRAVVVRGWQPRHWGRVQVVSYHSREAQRRLKMLHSHRGNVGRHRASDQLLLLSSR